MTWDDVQVLGPIFVVVALFTARQIVAYVRITLGPHDE